MPPDAGLSSLRANRTRYEALAAEALAACRPANEEAALAAIERAAGFAWMHHPGRFCDARLEAAALELGGRLPDAASSLATGIPGLFQPSPPAPGPKRRLLHVASTVYPVGGHARHIRNWIIQDDAAAHSLALTRQDRPCPAWLSDAVAASGGALLEPPPGASRLRRAQWLRGLARSGPEFVVLHTHHDDAVPLLALAPRDLPPVALYDHAVHVFGLGYSVADVVLCLFPAARALSLERRRPARTMPFPMPLSPPARERAAARKRLGLAPEDLLLLSVGAEYKYRPAAGWDFFETAREILRRRPGALLHVVGVPPGRSGAAGEGPSSLRLLGALDDPGDHFAAADLYLSSFPMGGMTAVLEACLAGVPPVLFDPGVAGQVTADDEALDSPGLFVRDAAEYVEAASRLLRDPGARGELGSRLRRRALEVHSVDGWRRRLQEARELLGGLSHAPQPVPLQPALETDLDRSLAALSAAQDWASCGGRKRGRRAWRPPRIFGLWRRLGLPPPGGNPARPKGS